MLRSCWKSARIASLLGTDGASGRGGGGGFATLSFLSGSWAIFASPGMLGRYRKSLGKRGRSEFIAVNDRGWRGVAVHWTVLGFSMVSFGLVASRFTSRQAGFLLLSLALPKRFIMDVWNFTTFMRVVAFIALGMALVIRGLFHHRSAPALKRMIAVDSSPDDSSRSTGERER